MLDKFLRWKKEVVMIAYDGENGKLKSAVLERTHVDGGRGSDWAKE